MIWSSRTLEKIQSGDLSLFNHGIVQGFWGGTQTGIYDDTKRQILFFEVEVDLYTSLVMVWLQEMLIKMD